MDDVRSYNFSGVSYANPDDVMTVLRNHDCKYAWVCMHDNDLLDDGTLKKPHTHFVCCTKSNHTVSAVRKWFKGLSVDDVEQNTLAQRCDSVCGMVRYLLHLDQPDKVLYSAERVQMLNVASERLFADYMRGDEGESRQFDVIMRYAMREITLLDAMRAAPELFIHKYSSMQRLIGDLRYNIERGVENYED